MDEKYLMAIKVSGLPTRRNNSVCTTYARYDIHIEDSDCVLCYIVCVLCYIVCVLCYIVCVLCYIVCVLCYIVCVLCFIVCTCPKRPP